MTGFTIAETLEKKYKKATPQFLQAVQESLKYIFDNKQKALNIFKKEFNALNQPEKTFNDYLTVWNKNLKVNKKDWTQSLRFWKTLYPRLLHEINPFLLKNKKIKIFNKQIKKI